MAAAFLCASLYVCAGRPASAAEAASRPPLEEILNPPDVSSTGPLLLSRPGSAPGTLASTTTARGTEPESPVRLPHRFSVGFNDLGGQFRFHLRQDWAAEFRMLTGNASSDVGSVQAFVFGLRGYKFLPERHSWRFYLGAETAYVKTSLHGINTNGNPNSVATVSGFGDTSGYALGAFGGVEYRLLKRLAIDFDVGPYLIGLRERVTGVSGSTLDFVGNTAINVYLF